MTGPRLCTVDGKPVKPAMDTFAFAVGYGDVVASRNGQEVPAAEALLALVDCVNRMVDTADAHAAQALSEPRSIL